MKRKRIFKKPIEPERISEERLFAIGFTKKMNMYFGHGISLMKIPMITSAWVGAKGLHVEKDLYNMDDVVKFIEYCKTL